MFPPKINEVTNNDQVNDLYSFIIIRASFKVPIYVQSLGSLVRKSKQRVSNLNVDNENRILSCHVSYSFIIQLLLFN
jgi:hypothetical protein